MSGNRPWRWTSTRPALLFAFLTGLTGCSGDDGGAAYKSYMARKTAFRDIIKEMGGNVDRQYYRIAGYEGNGWKIDLSGAQFEPERGMELIDALDRAGYITLLNLSRSSVTDEQLIQFDENGSGFAVMDLDLSNTAITDAAIEKLDSFMALQNVNLSGTQVSKDAVDRWMERRRQNKNLPRMFHNPKITM